MAAVHYVDFHAKNGVIEKATIKFRYGHVTVLKNGGVEIQTLERLPVMPEAHEVDLQQYAHLLERKNGHTRVSCEDYEKTWRQFAELFVFSPPCTGNEETPATFRNGDEEQLADILASFCEIYGLNERYETVEIEQIPGDRIYEIHVNGERANYGEDAEMCSDLKAITEYFGPDASSLEYNDGSYDDRSGFDARGYSLSLSLDKQGSARERLAIRRELSDLLENAGFPEPKRLFCLGGSGATITLPPPELVSKYAFQANYPRVPTFGAYTTKDNRSGLGSPERICTIETPFGVADVVIEDLAGKWYYPAVYIDGIYLFDYNHDFHKAIFAEIGDTVDVGGFECTVLENAAGPQYCAAA